MRISFTQFTTLASALIIGTAHADNYSVHYPAPALDRWNYPFNPTPGTRITASTFGNDPLGAEFDNRDGQFVVGFNTNGNIPVGLGAGNYNVTACTIEITYANDFVAEYDPSVDPFTVFLPESDPAYTPDTDLGAPIEIYGTGFRGGFTLANWAETSPFGNGSPLSPSIRNAFALAKNGAGAWVDASNCVRERWTPSPFAVGVIDGLKRGQLVPVGTVMRFELDVARADVQEFLGGALDAGRLRLTISSLTKVVQQGGSFPQFYCRENPLVVATGAGGATLTLEVTTNTCVPADLNCDGVVDAADLTIMLSSWGGTGVADINGDGIVDAADISALLSAWS